jgi:hypothetical protein
MNVFIIDTFGRPLQAVDLATAAVELLCDGFMVCASLLNDTDALYVRELHSGRHYFKIGQNRIFGPGVIVARRQGRRPRAPSFWNARSPERSNSAASRSRSGRPTVISQPCAF